ncbi:zinc finger protein 184 isoform X2 [Anabrus simplex]|uniref:zinc finger protein 184 isoform X2 n=1 Tax=Anabrus simplex TaxID=316456 RepID=UPI0034DCE48C
MITTMAGCEGPEYLQQCRLCRHTNEEFTDIFGEDGLKRNLAGKIRNCLSLMVREDDILPKRICTKCILMVEQLYTFRKMCTQSELSMECNLHRNLLEPEVSVKEVKMLPQSEKLKQVDLTAQVPLFEEDSSGEDMVEAENDPNTVPDKGDSCTSVQIGHPGPEDYVLMKEESFILNADEDNHRATAIEFHRSSVTESDKDILLVQKKRRQILPQMWDVFEKTVKSNNVIAVKHRRYIVSKSAFPCSLCGKCFDINQSLSNESDNITSINTMDKSNGKDAKALFPCHVCDKTFSFCNALKRHLQTHFNYKLYPCTLCGKGFSRKEHLTRHTLSHTGGRPYHCDVCNKPFTRKEHLTRHRVCHSLAVKQEDEAGTARVMEALRPFSCELCGHRFSRKDHLNQHQKRLHPMLYHNGDTSEETKPYTCCICKKNFTRKEHLVRHQGIHVREFLLASTQTSTGENVTFPLVPPH